jgi:hypothetical protein
VDQAGTKKGGEMTKYKREGGSPTSREIRGVGCKVVNNRIDGKDCMRQRVGCLVDGFENEDEKTRMYRDWKK